MRIGKRRHWVTAALWAAGSATPLFAAYSFTTLTSFTGANGANPWDDLTLSGNTLYGTTSGGQTYGEVFSLPVTGGSPTVLSTLSSSAEFPYSSVVLSGSTLYGTTIGGGVNNYGTVFSIPVTGGAPTVLAQFNGANGYGAYGDLTSSGTTLYGTASYSTSGPRGYVFSLPQTGGSFALSPFGFSGGQYPLAGLIVSGNTLIGTTTQGGTGNAGTVFSLPTTGGTPTPICNFNTSNGSQPESNLLLSGNTLYGTTLYGGANGSGVVFSLPMTGGSPTVLCSFNGNNGNTPSGALALIGNTLFGTTQMGGAYGYGEVYSVPITGGTPTVVVSFNQSNGAMPVGGLIASVNTLYGTTVYGGTSSAYDGTVFALTVATGGNWLTTTGGDWNATANWSSAFAPTSTSDAIFNLPNTYAITSAAAAVCNNLTVSAGNVTISPGSNTLTIGNELAVDGPASPSLNLSGGTFNITSYVAVGASATGSLTVNSAAHLNAGQYLISGQYAGSIGSITITGSGTTVQVQENVFAGQGGNGTVNLYDGATLKVTGTDSTASAQIAASVGTTGTITVGNNTSNTAMLTTPNFYVGGGSNTSGGSGTLTINNGGQVNVSGVTQVWNGNSKINLTGGTLTTGSLVLPGDPTRINWSGGSLVLTASSLILGRSNAAQDTLGSNSVSLTNGQALIISGANQNISVGDAAGQTATLNLSGGSSITIQPGGYTNRIGLNGTGTFNISGLGTLYNDLSGSGTEAGTISGSSGTINVSSQAKFSTGGFILAETANTSGAITIDNATMTTGSLYIGDNGAGQLTLRNGGTIANSGNTYIASNSTGATGTATISGTGTTLTTANIYVGCNGSTSAGSGILSISTGANVTVTGTTTLLDGQSSIYLTGGTFTTGILNDHNDPTRISWTGGTLNLTSSNLALSASGPLGDNLSIAAHMALNVTNGNSATVDTTGNDYLNINGGGTMSATSLELGDQISGYGKAIITDAGSVLSLSNTLWIGPQGGGSADFYILNGASVTANGQTDLGFESGKRGYLVIGSGMTTPSTLNTPALYLGGFLSSGSNVVGSGFGEIHINSGGQINVTGATRLLTSSSIIFLAGGTLNTGILDTGNDPARFYNNWTGGTLNLTSSGLTIGSGNTMGPTVVLPAGKNLSVSGATTISSGGTLTVAGGTFSAPSLNISSGAYYSQTGGSLTIGSLSPAIPTGFNWTGGTLKITSGSLNVGDEEAVELAKPNSANLSSGVSAAASGFNFGLGIQRGGVYAWGINSNGQLGNGSTISSAVSVAATNLSSGVTLISASRVNGLAVQNGGALAWGNNSSGQLGNGTTIGSSTPVAVSGLSVGVSAVAAGNYFSLAIQSGSVYAWGANGSGQLGNGTMGNASIPVAVTGLPAGVSTIAAGLVHSIALQNGAVYTWGSNENGQLGNGSLTDSSLPVSVSTLSAGVTSISAGEADSLAIQNGTVYGWGLNDINPQSSNGPLGYPKSFYEALSPIPIPGLSGTFTEVAAGQQDSFALSADGTIWEWGSDYYSTQQVTAPAGYAYTSISAPSLGSFSSAVATLAPISSAGSVAPITVNSGMNLQVTGAGQSINVSGVLTLNGGTISANAINVSGGTFVWNSGTLSITGTGSSFGTTLAVPNNGTLLLSGTITDPISVSAGGTFNIQPTGGTVGVRQLNTITITANTGSAANGLVFAQPGASTAIVTAGLSIAGSTGAWQGRLELTNNDLDVQNGNLATLTNQLKTGYNNGNWNGSTGITSATAGTDATHLHALGIIQNSTTGLPNGPLLYPTFEGFTATADTDVLIKYTYDGDANLDGKVDGSDYARIDAGYLSHGTMTGWFNGDFNYDGVIDGSDYTLIDNAFNTQGAQLTSQVAITTAQIATVSAVPEPTMAILTVAAVASLLGRRRRSPA